MPEPHSPPSADSRTRPQTPGASRSVPAGQRLRRPSWRDPRLLAGVLIVALSVSGVIALMTTQNHTTEVYAADRLLTVGDRLATEDLRVVQVQIDELPEAYLTVSGGLPDGAEFIAMVDEGELIPRRALAEEDPQGRQAMTIAVEHTLARGVEPGRLVDVWAADAGAPGAQQEVRVEQIAAAAQVSVITESSSTFGAQERVIVELLVEPEELPALLGATSSASTLSVVPAGAGAEADAEQEQEQEQETGPEPEPEDEA
ncbi:hypothetical protein [Nesterenkonia sp. DZ6]|uniref:hypothetical protein n=1 Tax=Nesterenkonia sp. DZ6 TaxID=2901229 RepID=UPI001F4CBC6E|nr:hypothetical protein [Nesterenkonia sp. DZ6]MCH8559815.1 hypothetical protein [Nesterenkonia sp. DZ6]